MADIELVIKIPERDYYLACKYSDALIAAYAHYIKEGTLLPKGHGRLIDASNLLTTTDYDGENEKSYVLCNEIDNAPTIIEADKEL